MVSHTFNGKIYRVVQTYQARLGSRSFARVSNGRRINGLQPTTELQPPNNSYNRISCLFPPPENIDSPTSPLPIHPWLALLIRPRRLPLVPNFSLSTHTVARTNPGNPNRREPPKRRTHKPRLTEQDSGRNTHRPARPTHQEQRSKREQKSSTVYRSPYTIY